MSSREAVAPFPVLLYRIDAADRLIDVGGAWREVAEANARRDLGPDRVLGRSLWDYVSDLTTQQLYRTMLTRVRRDRSPVRFRLRCDSPDARRLLAMELVADTDGSVQFRVTPVHLEPRVPVPLLEAHHTVAAGGLLTMCGWCQDLRLPDDQWVPVEEALQVLDLFGAVALPQVSHGICPRCSDQLMAMLDDSALCTAGTVTLGSWQPG